VAPLKKETPIMSDRHLELLEKIARNTNRILELEEKRERLTQVEREELRDLLNPQLKWKN
jgi:hypothetical protein